MDVNWQDSHFVGSESLNHLKKFEFSIKFPKISKITTNSKIKEMRSKPVKIFHLLFHPQNVRWWWDGEKRNFSFYYFISSLKDERKKVKIKTFKTDLIVACNKASRSQYTFKCKQDVRCTSERKKGIKWMKKQETEENLILLIVKWNLHSRQPWK